MLRIYGLPSSSFGYSSSVPGRIQYNNVSMPVEFYVWSTTDCYISISNSVTSAAATDYPIQAYGVPIPIGVTQETTTTQPGSKVFVSAIGVLGTAAGTTYAMPIQR